MKSKASIFRWTTFFVGLAILFNSAQSGAQTTPPPPQVPTSTEEMEAIRYSFYAYDRELPLEAKLEKRDEKTSGTRWNLSYESVHNQRVTAILSLPKVISAPCPAVLVMHGSGGNKDSDYVSAICQEMNKRGIAALSIDAQYRGDRTKPGHNGDLRPDSYTMRDAWVQDVIDLRRAVDYLQSRPDIRKDNIGFIGFSMGAMLGSVLGGVESRVACFLLAVPGGGFVNLVKHVDRYPKLKEKWPISMTPEVLKRVEEFAFVADPIYFIGKILPRPLLMIVATHDEIIPAEASSALIEAGKIPSKNILTIPTGHVMTPSIIFNIRNFIIESLKPSSNK